MKSEYIHSQKVKIFESHRIIYASRQLFCFMDKSQAFMYNFVAVSEILTIYSA